jgi:hypothetical protein
MNPRSRTPQELRGHLVPNVDILESLGDDNKKELIQCSVPSANSKILQAPCGVIVVMIFPPARWTKSTKQPRFEGEAK